MSETISNIPSIPTLNITFENKSTENNGKEEKQKNEQSTEWQGTFPQNFISKEKNKYQPLSRTKEEVTKVTGKKNLDPHINIALHVFHDEWKTLQRHESQTIVNTEMNVVPEFKERKSDLDKERRGSIGEKEDQEIFEFRKDSKEEQLQEPKKKEHKQKEDKPSGFTKMFQNLKFGGRKGSLGSTGEIDLSSTPTPKLNSSNVVCGEEITIKEHPSKYPFNSLFEKKVVSKVKKLNDDSKKLLPEEFKATKEEQVKPNLLSILRPSYKHSRAELLCERQKVSFPDKK